MGHILQARGQIFFCSCLCLRLCPCLLIHICAYPCIWEGGGKEERKEGRPTKAKRPPCTCIVGGQEASTHIHIYTPIHACAHKCTHMHKYTYKYKHMHTGAHICTHMHTHARICTDMHGYTYICTHMHICAHKCTHMHNYAHI